MKRMATSDMACNDCELIRFTIVGDFINFVAFAFAHRDTDNKQLVIFHLIHEPIADAAHFDLVALTRAMKTRRWNFWVLQPLG